MVSASLQAKTACNQSLHAFYALDLGDAEPATDHGFGRLPAARMAGHGWEEIVAVEREQRDVGRRANGRCPRHVAQQRDLAEVPALAFSPRRHAVDEDLDFAVVHDVEAVAVVAEAD